MRILRVNTLFFLVFLLSTIAIAQAQQPIVSDKTTTEFPSRKPAFASNATQIDTKHKQENAAMRRILSNGRDGTKGKAKQLRRTPQTKTENNPARQNNANAVLNYLKNLQMPEQDRANLRTAINAFFRKDFTKGLAAKAQIQGKLTYKVAQWYYLRSDQSPASANEIRAFYQQNPDWPDIDILQLRAEQALFRSYPQNSSDVAQFFKEHPPRYAEGKIILGTFYFEQGKMGLAKRYLSQAWNRKDLSEDLETLILSRFASVLTQQDLKQRIDHLLVKNRATDIPRARKIAALFGGEVPKIVEVRAAVIKRSPWQEANYTQLSEQARNSLGLRFSQIQHLRRARKHSSALNIISRLQSSEPERFVAPKEWWKERRRQIRIALRHRQYKLAYEIASRHHQLSAKNYWEAEFLSGWIALQFLNKPKQAGQHFQALYASVTKPNEKARSLYWLARTAQAENRPAAAQTYMQRAAQFGFTYYGKLAQEKLGQTSGAINSRSLPEPTRQEINSFFRRDAVKAISTTYHAGLNTLTPLFILKLARSLKTSGDLHLLGKMARAFGYASLSVRIAKIALEKGKPFEALAYPTDLMSKRYENYDRRVSKEFVYALARQESEFNAKAKSPVGARGLMQIMPGTAREIAERHNIAFDLKKLANDGDYGLKLGTAHIGDLIEQYNGSLVMTLIAYNAGPRRVREWIQYYGDPREPNIDIVDWVEQIPFTETRNYVKKIMTGLQIYRSYLNAQPTPNQIIQDLRRGRPASRSALPAKARRG